MKEMHSSWVRWSSFKDKTGQPMVEVAGCHFPVDLALAIANDIIDLVIDSADVRTDKMIDAFCDGHKEVVPRAYFCPPREVEERTA
jgi:hypothetical protein